MRHFPRQVKLKVSGTLKRETRAAILVEIPRQPKACWFPLSLIDKLVKDSSIAGIVQVSFMIPEWILEAKTRDGELVRLPESKSKHDPTAYDLENPPRQLDSDSQDYQDSDAPDYSDDDWDSQFQELDGKLKFK